MEDKKKVNDQDQEQEEVKTDENTSEDTEQTENTESTNEETQGTEDTAQNEDGSEEAPEDNPESQEEQIEDKVNEAQEDSRINEIVASNQLILGKLDNLEQLLNKVFLQQQIEDKKPVEVPNLMASKRHSFFDLD